MRLDPLIDEINNQDGKIGVYFNKSDHQNLNFDEFAQPLRDALYKRMEQFLPPRNQ